MPTETELSDQFRRAVATLEPRTELLVAGGLARGQALRRRRRITQTASGAGLAALIAGVTVAIWPAGSPGAGHHDQAAGPSTGAVRTSAAAPRKVTVTPQVLLHTALGLLPSGAKTSGYTGRAFPQWVGAELHYDDGHGVAAISVSVAVAGTDGQGAPSPCTVSGITTTTCTMLPGGGSLSTRRISDANPDHPAARISEWSADLVRADGIEITVSEWNAPLETGAARTRVDPPLTIARLTEMVGSPRWSAQASQAEIAAWAGLFIPDPTGGGPAAQTAAEKSAVIRAENRVASEARKAAKAAHDKTAGH